MKLTKCLQKKWQKWQIIQYFFSCWYISTQHLKVKYIIYVNKYFKKIILKQTCFLGWLGATTILFFMWYTWDIIFIIEIFQNIDKRNNKNGGEFKIFLLADIFADSIEKFEIWDISINIYQIFGTKTVFFLLIMGHNYDILDVLLKFTKISTKNYKMADNSIIYFLYEHTSLKSLRTEIY